MVVLLWYKRGSPRQYKLILVAAVPGDVTRHPQEAALIQATRYHLHEGGLAAPRRPLQ